jgi:glutathione synthase
MDEILYININKDSTFAILLALENQGCEIFYYLPKNLYFDCNNNKVKALASKISLSRQNNNHCQIINSEIVDLEDFDAILFRQDPPFNLDYITTSYILEKIKNRILIINDPSEIRNFPEKIFISEFSKYIAPTAITSNLAMIKDFINIHHKIVMKPLYSCGGDGVVVIDENDKNLASIFDMMIQNYQSPLMIQKYIKEVVNGDIRILLLDGEIIGSVRRIANIDDNRCNLHINGKAEIADLNEREIEIAKLVGNFLRKKGLIFVGIDIIGGYLTEINTTSPTCINEINSLNQDKVDFIPLEQLIAKKIIDKIIDKINKFQ